MHLTAVPAPTVRRHTGGLLHGKRAEYDCGSRPRGPRPRGARREALTTALAEQKTAIDAAHDEKAQAQIDAARRQKAEKLAAASRQIEEREARVAKALDARFAAGHKAWEDAFFEAAVQND